jgi:hypothetical protein
MGAGVHSSKSGSSKSVTLDANDVCDVCDVFLSHAGEQKKGIVDCVYQILVRLGGSRRKRRNQCVKVFLDQHSLPFGVTPWEVMKRTAGECRIGVTRSPPAPLRQCGPTHACPTKNAMLSF